MNARPMLILSDAPTAGTGLGRITNDLATRIATNMSDTFRVATAGYGGVCSRHLPYHQYILEGTKDFVCPTLPDIWRDWAGEEKGVLLVIWDLSRIGWLLRPELQCENPILREFLLKKPFEIWTYLPIDAEGPNGKLTFPLKENLKGADRVLAYGKWAAEVVDRTMDLPEGTTNWIPHGIDGRVFYERTRLFSRMNFRSYTQSFSLTGYVPNSIKNSDILISIVGTNQARKDWGLGIEVAARLARTHNIYLWIKIDKLERHWSIPALLVDYGLLERTMITLNELTDDEMAQAYSSSDIVLGIAPEGFGYVHAESLACGTPCIVGSYAGGAELAPQEMHVYPVAYRYESIWSCKRPVYDPEDWVNKAEDWIGKRIPQKSDYDWNLVFPKWEEWLKKGMA